ncbi:hypothetical protein [Enterovirga sp.]|uniref:hypothetical protein n=1 Tax=Enterovirga sp. TaxID=2026350 RepID=UPI002B6C48CD|nr:hypothetical protein [Enterovirga sp.]HMO28691.1 hypothetical protein [Enterovirga sp.]
MDSRDRQNLAVALVVLILIGIGYWVMTSIRLQGKIEECLMQRRLNCDQLVR